MQRPNVPDIGWDLSDVNYYKAKDDGIIFKVDVKGDFKLV